MPSIYGLDAAAEAVVNQAREIAQSVVARHAEDVDAKGRYPSEAMQALGAAGLNGLMIPKAAGGMGQGPRTYVAVAEELSFTRAAAQRLYVSQPALSKQIRQLEQGLRVALFERDGRSVALTAAGAALLPRARAIIASWEEAGRAVAAAAAAEEKVLTVGFQTRIGRDIVPAMTARMQEEMPAWRLRARPSSVAARRAHWPMCGCCPPCCNPPRPLPSA